MNTVFRGHIEETMECIAFHGSNLASIKNILTSGPQPGLKKRAFHGSGSCLDVTQLVDKAQCFAWEMIKTPEDEPAILVVAVTLGTYDTIVQYSTV